MDFSKLKKILVNQFMEWPMRGIGARVLFHDFFVGELKPNRMAGNNVVFEGTDPRGTATVIRDQVMGVHNPLSSNPPQWQAAQNHAKSVATTMKGLLGLGGPERDHVALEVRSTVQRVPAMPFPQALDYIASAVQPNVRERRPISGISKMLQLYPGYSEQAVIYDSMVTSVLASMGMPRVQGNARDLAHLQNYCSLVADLLTVPLLFNDFRPAGTSQKLDPADMSQELRASPLDGYSAIGGHLTRQGPVGPEWISIEEFFNHPDVVFEVSNSHPWAAKLSAFMNRRGLDRVLWHMGAIDGLLAAPSVAAPAPTTPSSTAPSATTTVNP
ncbi:hypothetical protein AB6809_10995 [Paraburkholderia sp. RCC_158]|uniref:hypothetical protein n=1 Tax=Paraburkholderia sp. RCC_158 TaxID=3239220 RepID=UPI003523F2F0